MELISQAENAALQRALRIALKSNIFALTKYRMLSHTKSTLFAPSIKNFAGLKKELCLPNLQSKEFIQG
jgi:hypothetical protein